MQHRIIDSRRNHRTIFMRSTIFARDILIGRPLADADRYAASQAVPRRAKRGAGTLRRPFSQNRQLRAE